MKLGTLLRISDINQAELKFKELSEYGFDSCQLVYKPAVYLKEHADRIRKAAEETGIEISSQFCGYYDNETTWDIYYGYCNAGLNVEAYRSERLKYLSEAAKFVSWLGITDMVIHAGFVPNNPFAPEYGTLVSVLHLLTQRCAALGVNILLETGAESPITLLRLIQDVDQNNLFINLDPANIIMYGYGNPVDALFTFGKYVRNIHGKDGLPPTHPRELGKETLVGQGSVDFYTMFKRLKELNYDRYIIIEREISGEQQIKDILYANAFFEELLAKVYL